MSSARPWPSARLRFRAGGLLEKFWPLFTWGDEVEVIEPKLLLAMLPDRAELKRSRHDPSKLSLRHMVVEFVPSGGERHQLFANTSNGLISSGRRNASLQLL